MLVNLTRPDWKAQEASALQAVVEMEATSSNFNKNIDWKEPNLVINCYA